MGRRAPGDGLCRATKVRSSRVNSSVSGATCYPGAQGSSFQVLGSRSLATRSGEPGWGGEAGLGAGPEDPGPQPPAAPTFLPPPRPCGQDRAQPNPGVPGSHSPLLKRPNSRQAADVFIGATSQSSGNWSGRTSYTFPQPVFGEWPGVQHNLPAAGIPFALHCGLGNALPPAGEGRYSKAVQIPASGYRSGGGDRVPSDLPAPGNAEARQAAGMASPGRPRLALLH